MQPYPSFFLLFKGASSPESSMVFVDRVSLRNDRVKLLEKGSPHGLCLMESGKLLPGVHVAIANPDTLGQCADSHLGEIWVSSPHNSPSLLGPYQCSNLRNELSSSSSSPSATSTTSSSNSSSSATGTTSVTVNGDIHEGTSQSMSQQQNISSGSDILHARLATGDVEREYARTGFLGFVRRTEMTQSDGGRLAF
ncbi:unnamed protein product [Protopolystoma xenopodis]|uniref:Uncharacterized protein n=1 Tax=Protopolystoma xenopodis TaxID=117903 RepID=A0A448XC98_9PLAT|nr:unnamed protein product [Protopolystoma xenopodis]